MMQAEGVCRRLDPEFDMWETARPIVEASMRRELGVEGRLGDFLDNMDRARRTLEKLPDATENIAKLAKAWADGDIDLTPPETAKAAAHHSLKPALYVGLGAALALGTAYAAVHF